MYLEQATLVVGDYDEAIGFFVDVLGFELVADAPATSDDGRPKRWVVVRPPGAATGLLLARADGSQQVAAMGEQVGGRVGFFLRVDDFDATLERLEQAGVEFVGQPRTEAYGEVVVFVDVAGNRWDLLGPHPDGGAPSSPMVSIRRERPDDESEVRAVHVAAFAKGGSEPVEARLLDALRGCDGWLPELSWVAEVDGRVVGHNVCTRGFVGEVACVGLGPIGVLPDRQLDGIGSQLMLAMIGAADATGTPLIALLGAPDYYRRFGFVASTELGIQAPDPAWGPFFQVRPLSGWRADIVGPFRYATPFDDLD